MDIQPDERTAAFLTETQRRFRAAILGAAFGALLALLSRRR